MCVHAVLMRQRRDGERLVLHLFSDLNTTAFHALPGDDVPLREEVVPITGIQVTFNGYRISRIHLEPEGLELAAARAGDSTQVTVPRLEVHSMVVAELEPGATGR